MTSWVSRARSLPELGADEGERSRASARFKERGDAGGGLASGAGADDSEPKLGVDAVSRIEGEGGIEGRLDGIDAGRERAGRPVSHFDGQETQCPQERLPKEVKVTTSRPEFTRVKRTVDVGNTLCVSCITGDFSRSPLVLG